MHVERKAAAVFSLVAAGFIAVPVFGINVTEPAGAAHGYPALYNVQGKKLADGEFRQWVENDLLQIAITYKFPDGGLFEEKARFRQEAQLTQEHWSWRELKDEKPQREFIVDFLSRTATAHIRKDNKDVSDKIDIEKDRTFAGFGFSLALSNVRKTPLKRRRNSAQGSWLFVVPNLKTTSCDC